MIDGQMVQLTERIDAVIRLVRSLKEENASLKKEILAIRCQDASFEPDSRRSEFFEESDISTLSHPTDDHPAATHISPVERQTVPELNPDPAPADTTESAPLRLNPEYDPFFENWEEFEENSPELSDGAASVTETTDDFSFSSAAEPPSQQTADKEAPKPQDPYSRLDIFY